MKRLAILLCLIIGMLPAVSMAEDPFVLRYMTGSSGNLWLAEQQIIANFEAANPDVKVETTVVSGTAEFVTALKTKFAAGEPPDVFNFQGGNRTIEFAREGHLLDLTDQPFMDRQYEADRGLNTYQDRVYAFALDYQATGLFINMDAMNKYLPDFVIEDAPKCFPEFLALAEELRQAGMESPILCAGKDINNVSQVDFQYLATVVWYNNPDYYLEMLRGERHFNDQFIRDMFDKYGQMREYMTEDALGVDNDEAIKRFIRGEGAMWVAHGGTITRFRELDPELNCYIVPSIFVDKPEDQVFNIGVCNSIQIVSSTENVDACLRFLEHYTNDESSSLLINVGRAFSAVKGMSEVPDPAWAPCVPWLSTDRRIGHADLVWIPGIKDVMKEVTQKWFLGDSLDSVLDEWESQHQRLMAADPAYIEEYLATH